MSDMIYKSGLDIRKILNKSFAKYETEIVNNTLHKNLERNKL